MADKTLRGRFVWHELMTPDAAASHGFYSKALGWKSQPYEQDPSYNMFAAPSGPVGGTVEFTDGPPHWLPVIGSTDLEGTLRQATELGGKVVKEIASAGNGRYALLSDPQGATFGVYSNEETPAKEKPAKRGEFRWHELATTDVQAAFDFYAALFGWDKVREHDMGADGVYLIFGRNDIELGGIWVKPASMQGPPNWLGYVRVKDVNPIVGKVKKSGGTLVHGPMEVPGGDWIAQFLDPQGALFAVHATKADMQPPAPAARPAAEPAQASADSMAETTVLTDIPEPEAKVRSASKKPKSAAKPAPKKAASKKKAAGKRAAAKKAAKKGGKKKAGKKQAAKKKSVAKSAKRAARKVTRKATKKKSVKKQKRAAKKKAAKKARKGK